MFRKTQGEPLKPDHAFAFCRASFLMTLAMGRIPHAGSRHLPVHHQIPEFTQTHVHQVGDAIQPSHPLSSPYPPTLNLSQHQGLFQGVFHIRWSKYWSFSFSISPSNEYSELISFRIDWFHLLAVQGTLKSLLKHHRFKNINSSVFSLLYGPTLTFMTTGKTIALTRRTFVSKVSAF